MKAIRLVFPLRPLPAGATRSLSRMAGLVGILAGVLALAAWSVLPAAAVRHIRLLSQIHPYSALGFALVGLALRLERFSRASLWVFRACKLFRVSVGLLGLLTLAQAWLGWNLGIDQLIVHDPNLAKPALMAPAAALSFYLLGCALVLLSAGRSMISQILSLVVTSITVATLIARGYALLAPQAVPDYLIMPAATALVLLILSIGVLHSNTDRSLVAVVTSDSKGGIMARRLLPASLAIPAALGLLRVMGQQAGWFGPGMGLVLHVVATMLLLALFVWWNAVTMNRMVSENERFEQAVEDTRRMFLEVLQNVDVAVYGHDLEGNFTFFNAAAERLLGYSGHDALHASVYSVIAAESAKAARMMLGSKLIGGPAAPERLTLRTSTGEQECDVMTSVCHRDCYPVGFFSVVVPVANETAAEDAVAELVPAPIGAS